MYRAVTFNFIKLENSLFSLNTGFKMPRGGKKGTDGHGSTLNPELGRQRQVDLWRPTWSIE